MSNDHNFQEKSFAELLESSITEPQYLVPGQQIKAEIISISGGCIFLQLGGKSEGQIDAEELTDKEGNITVKTGDMITAYFHAARDGEMIFTTKIGGDKADNAALKTAFTKKIPVEGVIAREIKGGYEITIGEIRAFCPYSQIALRRVDNPEELIGTKQNFRIIEFKENGRNILVSRKIIQQEERDAEIAILKGRLHEQMKISGTIASIQSFGAFVDLGVVQGLIPISEISRERIDDIQAVLSVGEEVEAEIISLDWSNERITLSMKALLADPWDSILETYKPGHKYSGEVARVTDFGAFVTLEPGLDGLIHISDLNSDPMNKNREHSVKQGEKITVVINSIDVEKRRISLKPASSLEEDTAYQQYIKPESDSYNPFADFFNKKKSDKR